MLRIDAAWVKVLLLSVATTSVLSACGESDADDDVTVPSGSQGSGGASTGGPDCDGYSNTCASTPAGTVCIPAGFFTMGSDEEVLSQDALTSPVRQVCMPSYAIQIHEVTVADYRTCVTNGACSEPLSSTNCNYYLSTLEGLEGRAEHPVNCVSLAQAQAYCEFVEMRLPTEAEWEKAARGVDGRRYPWGNDAPTCDHAVARLDSSLCPTDKTEPVGSKPLGDSPYGVKDMLGNVEEWVSDSYSEGVGYDPAALDNPQGSAGTYAITRGGNYVSSPEGNRLTAFYRSWGAGDAYHTRGIRCVAAPH